MTHISIVTTGITPALAGTTAFIYRTVGVYWDHPRACRYNFSSHVIPPRILGSPPRLRVQQERFNYSAFHHGITPALAGTTAGIEFEMTVKRDHPRACGYNLQKQHQQGFGSGSPPRLRVQRFMKPVKAYILRITPALAGTTIE